MKELESQSDCFKYSAAHDARKLPLASRNVDFQIQNEIILEVFWRAADQKDHSDANYSLLSVEFSGHTLRTLSRSSCDLFRKVNLDERCR